MSVKGKHSKSPGFIPGDHWVVCDRCGMDIRSSDARETWDNLVVCPDDWEPRHPQDFVRGVPENTAARGLVRPPPADIFVDVCSPSAIAGVAVAGCAIAGYSAGDIPDGTFDNSL